MNTAGEIAEILQPYLQEQHAVSEEALRHLISEWNQEGSFLDFLVGKKLMPHTTAQTLAAVRKGDLKVSVESVLGVTRKKSLPAANRPTIGMRIGRYVLQEQLGESTSATVFRAHSETLNAQVAIKIFMPLAEPTDPEAPTRFRSAAQTLLRLEHPHIVRILDVDSEGRIPYIVMEYAGENTLATQIKNQGKLPAPRIAQIGLAVVEALEAARQAGLLHRDVRPSNIVEHRDGHVKLIDFRFTKPRPEASEPARQLDAEAPAYVAPEQWTRPDSIDFRADMYGLGATLYHAAVGRPPLEPKSRVEPARDEPIPIWQLEPSFDVHLAATIHRMLRKQPEERFGSWADVRSALSNSPIRAPLTISEETLAGQESEPVPVPVRVFLPLEPESESESDIETEPEPEPPPPALSMAPPPSEPLMRKWEELTPTRQIALVGVVLLLILLACIWFGVRA